MAKRHSYYKRLNDDMHDVCAERNILRTERDNARKSVEAMKKKIRAAYADIERRDAELREKEAKEIGEWAYEKQKMVIDRNRALNRAIAERDALIRDMYEEMRDYDLIGCCRYEQRMSELGIEVD